LHFFIQTLIWLDYFNKFFGKKENLLNLKKCFSLCIEGYIRQLMSSCN